MSQKVGSSVRPFKFEGSENVSGDGSEAHRYFWEDPDARRIIRDIAAEDRAAAAKKLKMLPVGSSRHTIVHVDVLNERCETRETKSGKFLLKSLGLSDEEEVPTAPCEPTSQGILVSLPVENPLPPVRRDPGQRLKAKRVSSKAFRRRIRGGF